MTQTFTSGGARRPLAARMRAICEWFTRQMISVFPDQYRSSTTQSPQTTGSSQPNSDCATAGALTGPPYATTSLVCLDRETTTGKQKAAPPTPKGWQRRPQMGPDAPPVPVAPHALAESQGCSTDTGVPVGSATQR